MDKAAAAAAAAAAPAAAAAALSGIVRPSHIGTEKHQQH